MVIAAAVAPAHAFGALGRPDLGLGILDLGFVSELVPVEDTDVVALVDPVVGQRQIRPAIGGRIEGFPTQSGVLPFCQPWM